MRCWPEAPDALSREARNSVLPAAKNGIVLVGRNMRRENLRLLLLTGKSSWFHVMWSIFEESREE
jgi:hypothetical protein